MRHICTILEKKLGLGSEMFKNKDMSTQEECHTGNPDPTTRGELITGNVDDSALPVNAQISPRGNEDAECFASGIKYFFRCSYFRSIICLLAYLRQ